MQTPLPQPFDISNLEPVLLQATLKLPSLSPADVRAGSHLFSSALADGGYCDARRNPAVLTELLTRCLLAVSTELLEQPDRVLACFDTDRFGPRSERSCDLLVASGAGATKNAFWIERRVRRWKMSDECWAAVRAGIVTMAVGSLVTIGRLPLTTFSEPALH
ncbi:hypothetical protein [Botrimarina mediterranea]|uniref:Uncharacterized protein n=1 Tax=Botrimarina mediterranea TaxID=2528022 RepID=A0A518K7A3_9BACT|nr:hypothetical protein [Botrimarina mediterranea]QDV73670.1 hypothetical protein Spa11_18690 [Botrimarina mediterranea]QDV78260.1 hypothetical protein K2D_18670 [Planctomycetes bacterium K2D]